MTIRDRIPAVFSGQTPDLVPYMLDLVDQNGAY
jgi:hypothetical protein